MLHVLDSAVILHCCYRDVSRDNEDKEVIEILDETFRNNGLFRDNDGNEGLFNRDDMLLEYAQM
jgi:hypothetical protein